MLILKSIQCLSQPVVELSEKLGSGSGLTTTTCVADPWHPLASVKVAV